ncbi:hypothetical protein LPTSP4_19500 [Leptospira ryugenii]|uniref:Lcl C-terminal domain-containing protein n=1 Tax=Leptospira ryugenii TaxID=1917863 RepID=A0A2P2E0K2_9LEPT|nr:DUF1566 domain-containing protein [Leptospira ryugenii]GBF50425.1 hypothetical protein LPTSP4_19500 [Leptospira ryugenii]
MLLNTISRQFTSFCGLNSNNNANSLGSKIITSFRFASGQTGLNKDYVGSISGTNINIEIPYGLGLNLVPTFEFTGKSVSVGSVEQTSASTINNFASNSIYTVTAFDGTTQNYTVNVYQITPVADTGQTNCFNYGTPASCATTSASFPNQDGELQNFPNAKGTQPITTNSGYPNDPINKDTLKGIVWKTCHEGQTGSGCAGTASNLDHTSATTACNNLNSLNSGAGYAGLKNWRLPSIQELNQLMEYNGSTNNTNYWNSTLFPNPPSSNTSPFAWSSSTLIGAGAAMSHNNQYITNTATSSFNRAHCVSGFPQPSFDMVDNGNGTILDKRTKLIWQKCALGQTNDASCTGTPSLQNWSNSLLGCKNLTLAGKSWRLPNVNEMVTLLDLSLLSTQKINATYFPNFSAAGVAYDTSSANQQNVVYNQMFMPSAPEFQGISGKGVSNNYNARCVAGPE